MEKNDLTISLKNSERLLQKVTDERDLLKSSLGSELKPAQDQLKDIINERDLLSSFLKFTADSTISFSKLLSQISIGVMSNFLFKLANLDDITSHISTTRDSLKSLELPETISEDLKTLITVKLYEAMDVKSSVDDSRAWHEAKNKAEQEIAASRSRIASLTAELEGVNNSLAGEKNSADVLRGEIAGLKSRLEKADAGAKDQAKADEEIDKVKAERERLEKQLLVNTNEIGDLKLQVNEIEDLRIKVNRIKLLEEQISNLKSLKQITLDQNTKALAEKDQKENELVNKLKEIEQQLESAKAEKSKGESDEIKKVNEASSKDLEVKIDRLNKTIESKDSEISKLITQKDESEKSLRAELQKLAQDVNDKNADIEELKEGIQVPATEAQQIKDLADEIDEREKETDNLKEKVVSAEELASKQNVQDDLITAKDSSVKAAEERISALETDKRNLEVEFDSLKQQKEALHQKISEFELKHGSLEVASKDIELLRAEVNAKFDKISELELVLAAPKKEAAPKEVDEPSEDIKAELEKLRKDVLSLQDEIQLRSENETTLLKQIEDLKVSLKSAEDTQTTVSPVKNTEVETDQAPQDEITVKDEETDKSESAKLIKQIQEPSSELDSQTEELESSNENETNPIEQNIHKPEVKLADLQSQSATLAQQEISSPPKIEIIESSPAHKLTDEPVLSDGVTGEADVQQAKAREADEIAQVHAVESDVIKLRMYLEKVFDHIALMDIDLIEKNEEIAALTGEVAIAEKYKDSQKAIVHILSLAVKGIKSIGESTGVDASQEVKKIEKDIEIVKKSIRKIEVTSKQCSSRDIILQNAPINITVNSPTDPSLGGNYAIPVSEAAIEEVLKGTKALSESQRSESEKVHETSKRLVKVKLTNEKLTDNIANLTSIISATAEDINKVEIESLRNEDIVRNLKSAMKVLLDILNSGDESMQHIAHEMEHSLGATSAMNSPLKHTETPDSGAFGNDLSIKAIVQIGDQSASVNHESKIQADIEKASEQKNKLSIEKEARCTRIRELQQELISKQDSINDYILSNKQKEAETTQYHDALKKVKLILKQLPGMMHSIPVSVEHEQKSIVNKEGSHRSIDTGRSRETEKRQHIMDTDKPTVKVSHSAPTPDDPKAVDIESTISYHLEKLNELCGEQNQTVDHIKALEEQLCKIRLDSEKITQNIAANKSKADEIRKEIGEITTEIKKTSENLDHRRKLVDLLVEIQKEAHLLRSTEDIQTFAETTIDNLKLSEATDKSEDRSRQVGSLLYNSEAVDPATAQAAVYDRFIFEEVFSCIERLAYAVQEESTNQAKAILLYSDLSNQLNVNMQENLVRLEQKMEESSELFTSDVETAKNSRSIEYLVEAADRVLEVESENQKDLCALVDHMYERAPKQKKKLSYSSPARRTDSSGKK